MRLLRASRKRCSETPRFFYFSVANLTLRRALFLGRGVFWFSVVLSVWFPNRTRNQKLCVHSTGLYMCSAVPAIAIISTQFCWVSRSSRITDLLAWCCICNFLRLVLEFISLVAYCCPAAVTAVSSSSSSSFSYCCNWLKWIARRSSLDLKTSVVCAIDAKLQK